MVIDSDVDEFPACTLAAAIARAASGDAMADTLEPAKFLDVDMDDLAWFLALIAWMWLLRLEAGEPAEAAAFENARDAGFGDADLGCDVLLGAAFTAQTFHGIARGRRDLDWRRKGSRGSIAQTTHAFCEEAFDPLSNGPRGGVELARGRGFAHPAIHNCTN